MKPKTMMLMVVAIGCGLVASYMTSRLLAERQQQPQEVKVKVLVAKAKVPQFTHLKEPEKFFEEKELPEGAFPKKAITSFEDLKGKRIAKALNEESFVTADDLLSQGADGLSAVLGPGMRAVSIKVNPESVVAGFVVPGSRVDIVTTIRRGDADSESKIILQDMLVLAVDQKANKDPEGGPAMLGQTVTLAAKPDEALQLSLAGAIGELRLVLRGAGDGEIIRIPGAKMTTLGRQRSDGEKSNDNGLSGSGLPPVPTIPTPPKLEAPVAIAPPPEIEQPKPEEPVETHKLTIVSGEYSHTTVFVKDKAEGWKIGASTKSQSDDRRRDAVPPPPVLPSTAPTKKSDSPATAPVSDAGLGGTSGARGGVRTRNDKQGQ